MARISSVSLCLFILVVEQLKQITSSEDFPVITLSQGILKGKKVTPSDVSPYYAFLGIPYAKPPLGSLRFKAPVAADPWNGTREALQEGNYCWQRKTGNEDCLFINVYTPQVPCSGPLKPVMVFIHGGGFLYGSGNKQGQGPEFLLNSGVVFASFNYRLGVFGFLSTEDAASPGNAGLKDQVQALRWVKENIAAFCGDPNRVTIMGVSAGGASVQYHMLSPMSKGLFHGGIAHSGSAINPWAMAVKARERAFLLGASLGFSGNASQELVDLLRGIEAHKLQTAAAPVALEEDKRRLVYFNFVPSVEPAVAGEVAFLPDNPVRLLDLGKVHDVPYITGMTTAEFLSFLPAKGNSNALSEIDKTFKEVFEPDLRFCSKEGIDNGFLAKMRSFYFGDQPLGKDQLVKFTELGTDLFFQEGIVYSAALLSLHKYSQVYLYQFNYVGGLGSNSGNKDVPGVSHMGDLGYVLENGLSSSDTRDLAVRFRMVTMWTNFAKTGNPTPNASDDIPIWHSYLSDKEYLEIGSELKLKLHVDSKRMNFWLTYCHL